MIIQEIKLFKIITESLPLIGWFNRYDEIRTVCYHHVSDLIKSFSMNFNSVYFKDLKL